MREFLVACAIFVISFLGLLYLEFHVVWAGLIAAILAVLGVVLIVIPANTGGGSWLD